MIFLDTDHLSIVADPKARRHAELYARLDRCGQPLAVPVICVEEQCKGWLARIHHARDIRGQLTGYERLARLFYFFRNWEIAAFDELAAASYESLRAMKIRIGSQDLKIAACALADDALLLSANLRDFQRVPELRVENWLPP